MIRVLHVVSSLRAGSGVMSVLMNYHRLLDRERICFDYLYFKSADSDCIQEIQSLGGRVFSMDRPSISSAFSRETDLFFAAHANEWQVVHCHPIFLSAIVGAAAKKNGARHLVQHSHTAKLSAKPLTAVRNGLLLRFGRRWITDYAACSDEAAEIFTWCKKDEVFLLLNTPELERFSFRAEDRARVRSELGIASSDHVLGHVGRFSPEKNHIFLLEVFSAVLNLEPSAQLLLVGNGPLLEKVHRHASAMNISDKVHFAGEFRDVSALYSAMDVFVMPSTQEGFGLAAIEAQANGLYCLLSDAMPMATAATDLAVRLSVDSPAEMWADAIVERFSRPRSDCPRQALADAGFDLSRQAKRLMDYYEGMA